MTHPVSATLPHATVHGWREAGVCCFRNLPYAQAPVGPLRFSPPQPLDCEGHIDAQQPLTVPPQFPSRLRDAMGDFEAPQSEDCLRLTLWTPAADARRRPVLVWLHGGAWQSGAGALDWYHGAELAARGDIVVVAPNYRLGALGWMALPDGTANLGLLDQEAAVDWVVAHIAHFGGDPEQITVMGQSAGAMSVASMLMRTPRFQRGIMQSPSLGRGFRPLDKAREIATLFLHAAGVRDLDEARALPVNALLQAQRHPEVTEWLANEGAQRSLFGPVADGHVIPLDPHPALAHGGAKADVIVGYNLDEMAAFPGRGLDDASRALGDQIYGAPARQWAQDATAQGRRAWSYRFDLRPNATFGACHCVELPFVFNSFDAFAQAPMLQGLSADDAQRVSAQMQSAWLAFVKTGDPGWAPWPHQTLWR